jgi:hypothetical protein
MKRCQWYIYIEKERERSGSDFSNSFVSPCHVLRSREKKKNHHEQKRERLLLCDDLKKQTFHYTCIFFLFSRLVESNRLTTGIYLLLKLTLLREKKTITCDTFIFE